MRDDDSRAPGDDRRQVMFGKIGITAIIAILTIYPIGMVIAAVHFSGILR